MNKRMLSVFSLLLTMGIMNGSGAREQYYKYYTQAQADARAAQEAVDKSLENIYQTKKGNAYQVIKKAYLNCHGNYEECEPLRKKTRKALNVLKKTPEYAELAPLLKDQAYFENRQSGLRKILTIDASYPLDTWTKREERLNDAINSNTLGKEADANDTILEWAEDIHEDEASANDRLRDIINEVEASNE